MIQLMVYVALILVGLCLGSFVNALVWRLHEQSKKRKNRAATDKQLSIATGRSMCPHCKHELASKDLVPVISWLTLGGKCRYCRKPIGWQYPIVELLVALLFVASYQFWPYTLGEVGSSVLFVTWLAVLVVGVALAVYDLKWMLLPNRLVVVLGILGVIFAGTSLNGHITSPLEIAMAVAVSGGIFYVLFQLSVGKWIGGGDVKMGAVLGLFMQDAVQAFLMLFFASLLGCMFALVLVAMKKYHKGARIPFGPFLLLATYIVVMFGTAIQDWYQSLFLI